MLATETAEEQGAISGKYAFDAGTVLYSKIRPALAKACISPSLGMCSADMYPIIPNKRLRRDYLLMQLLSARFTDWATLESTTIFGERTEVLSPPVAGMPYIRVVAATLFGDVKMYSLSQVPEGRLRRMWKTLRGK